jgi:hypothetical protein
MTAMPESTLCQIDRLLSPAIRTPADWDGVRCLYLDGQPSDSCLPNFSGGWHTIVAVNGPSASDELRQVESDRSFFADLALRKWANSPSEYRNQYIAKIADTRMIRRLRIHAISYREDTALRAWPKLLKRHFQGPIEINYIKELVNPDNKVRMVHFPLLPEIGPLRQNSVIPLFIMAEFIAKLHCEIAVLMNEIPAKYTGLLVFADKISGDGVESHPKVKVLNKLLQTWYKDKIRVRNNKEAETYCGEFLADNLAGILTPTLMDRFHPWRNQVKTMKKNHILSWSYLDHNATIQDMK